MEEFLIMLKNVAMLVFLAMPGFIIVKSKLLNSQDSNIVSKVTLYIAVPFFIIGSTLNVNLTGEIALKFLIIALICTAGIFILLFISRFFLKKSKNELQRGLERFCVVFTNNGFLGLPLAEAVFGQTIPEVLSLIVIINIVSNIFLMIMGGFMFSGDKKSISIKSVLTSPVLIAFIVAIILNLTNVKSIVPEVQTYSNYFKNLVTPLSMIILGMKFADISLSKIFTNSKVYYICLLKLIVMPCIIMAIILVLNIFVTIDKNIIYATFIGFATPTASLATSLADRYGVGEEESTLYVLGTTLFSVITLPILYYLLNLFIL